MTAAAEKLIEIVPLSKHIGAEIRGVDLSKPVDEDTRKAIYQAWLDHIVLVFRGQNLSQEDHLRATALFGEHAGIRRPPKYFPAGFNRVLPGIMFISNIPLVIRRHAVIKREYLINKLMGKNSSVLKTK